MLVHDQNPTITCLSFLMMRRPPRSTLSPYATLFRSSTGDNCAVGTVVNNGNEPYPVGTNLVVWTATDIHGNSAICTQQVIVVDAQNPTITCPAAVTVNADLGQCSATNVDLGTPTTGDNCAVATVVNNGNEPYPVGTNLVIWTATDIHGKSATCTQQVIVVDGQNPSITCPAAVTVNADLGQCSATNVDLGTPSTGDNCAVATVVNNGSEPRPEERRVGKESRSGRQPNHSKKTQQVIVVDNQTPTITCPAAVT